jgi:replicative DNA helicase
VSSPEENSIPEDPGHDGAPLPDEAPLPTEADLAAMGAPETEDPHSEPNAGPDLPPMAESRLPVQLGAVMDAMVTGSEEAAQAAAADLLQLARTPPHSLDAEQNLLGGLLIEPSAYDAVDNEGLRPEDFYVPAHGLIFRTMQELHNVGEPIDTLTVVEALTQKGELAQAGGATKIARLDSTPTAAHVGAYARLIREKATLRRLIEAATRVVQSAFRQDRKVVDIIDEAERSILAISEQSARKGILRMSELVQRAMDQLEKMYNEKNPVTGLATGFRDFDKLTAGLQPGELIIVAARPSMGKTAFTLNLASHVAMREQAPVAFFSLEMGADQLTMRLVGSEARIDLGNLRRGFLQRHELSQLVQVAGELGEAPLYIDETPALSIAEMRNKCRRMHQQMGIKMAIVDYLQLMRGPDGIDNKVHEVGEISRGLKGIARELNIPVIALSQLNRGVESRNDKRPMLSDLRESGAIEQDADVIAFLYREEYYLRDATPEDKLGIAELIVAKHRNGPTGTVEMRFFSNFTRFADLEKQHDDYM